MSVEFFDALSTLASRNTKEGYIALATPKAMYDVFDGAKLFDVLQSFGVDPTKCWTARCKDGKSYLAFPGLNLVEGQPVLLFNFQSKDRDTNLIPLANPNTLFYRLTETKPFNQYVINIAGVDFPIALNQEGEVPAVGTIESLKIRVVEGGGGSYAKLIDIVREHGDDNLAIELIVTELMSRVSEKYGRSYSMKVEGWDTIINIPASMGQSLELDQINSADLELPQRLYIKMIMTKNKNYTAKYEYTDIPF